MKKRVPASTTTRKRIEDLISGVEGKAERSDLVKLAAQLIIEEALEGEVQEQLGRGYYERGESVGHRNGYRLGKLDTAEGRIDYAVPQVRGLEGWKSAVRSALSGRSEELERLAIEMYSRGLSVRDIEAAFVDEAGRCVLSKSAVSIVTERLWQDYQSSRVETCRVRRGVSVRRWHCRATASGTTARSGIGRLGYHEPGQQSVARPVTRDEGRYGSCKEFLRDLKSRGLRDPCSSSRTVHRV